MQNIVRKRFFAFVIDYWRGIMVEKDNPKRSPMIRTLEKWWSAFDGINFALGGNKPDVECAKKIARSILDAGNTSGNRVYRISRDDHSIVDIVDREESVINFFARFPKVFEGEILGEFQWDKKRTAPNGRENYGVVYSPSGKRLFYAVPHSVSCY
jgi:hypothetical protein